MTNKLHDLIVRQIESGGPISVASYMDLCLSHPEYGYYKSRDPLGVEGDFTTAPEISQLFGEMIGVWLADIWQRLKEPQRLILCEFGPGRGTLMRDILRVAEKLGFANILSVYLIETSEVLAEKQRSLIPLAAWHKTFETVPDDAPIVCLGNEFLDALPVRQLMKTKSGWRERLIGTKEGRLAFTTGAAPYSLNSAEAKDGDIFEFSPARDHIWSEICVRIKNQKGAALMIDYGHGETKTGNTLQAVKNHAYANVLEQPGEQDITSHVDFARLKKLAENLEIHGPVSQNEFLSSLGIEIRTQKLAELNPDKAEAINSGLKRLIHRDEMGQLFKAIYVSNV